MRSCSIAILGIAVGCAATPVIAQTQQRMDACRHFISFPAAASQSHIDACAALIQSGKISGHDLAQAFDNRGIGYKQRALVEKEGMLAGHSITDRANAHDLLLSGQLGSQFHDAYRSDANYASALADFTEAIRLEPNEITYYVDRADLHRFAGKTDLAIADYSTALQLWLSKSGILRPGLSIVDLYCSRGSAWAEKKQYDRAIADFTEAIKFARPSIDNFALNARSLAYQALGDEAHARADQISACKYSEYGTVAASNSQVDACTGLIRSGKISGHDLALAFDNRGNGYKRRALIGKNVFFADRKIADGADTRNLLLSGTWDANFHQAYRSDANYASALADFAAAIKLEPNARSYYVDRADLRRFAGEIDLAIADYSTALQLSQSADIYLSRGNAWAEKKQYDRAIADFTEALKLAPNDYFILTARASAHHAMGDEARARADQEQILQILPDPH